MRKIIDYFIKYHVAVNIVILAFLLFGILGVTSLKSSYFPLAESHTVQIAVTYPGASPFEIEEGVILKIEDNLKGLIGVERVTSISRENSGSITVEVEKERDINFMLLEVKNAVDRVPSYPIGMEPLVVSKQEQIRSTINFSLTGDNTSLIKLKEIGRQIENDLRAINGISQISVSGYPQEEIEIAVNENQLLAYDLSFESIAQSIAKSNIIVTGGQVKTNAEEFLIRANNKFYYADELANIEVLSKPDGTRVLLKDVAQVSDRFSETPNRIYVGNDISVNISVNSTNSEDVITAAASVRDYIEEYNEINDNFTLTVLNDQSITLTERNKLLIENIFQGMLLVLLFLSLFLNSRLAFWVAFGLPVSFLGMFIFAPMFGVTINVLSTFGMIIVIGILVDDGIVIAENIYQHYEKGKTPEQAAIDGVMEVLPAIVSAILTTILAFSIFLFLDGGIGEFFGEVSVVVILTLAVSLVEALIILPAHLAHSKALRKQNNTPKAGLAGAFQKVFSKLRYINRLGDAIMRWLRDTLYSPSLRFALQHKFFTFSIFVVFLILTYGSFGGGIIRGAFFPQIASDQVRISLNMPNGTNEKVTDSIISLIEQRAIEVTDQISEEYFGNDGEKQLVKNIIKNVGPGSSSASLSINLLEGEERPNEITSRLVTNRIQERVGLIFGVESLVFGSGGNFGGSPVSISFLGNNITELKAVKTALKERLENNVLLKDVTDNDPAGIKEIRIKLNETAYALGLNLRTVMTQVRAGFFGSQAQRFQRGQDEIRVWIRYNRENRSSIKSLDNMRILVPNGGRIPLKEIASYEIARGDVAINHLEGRREIQVSADIKDPKKTSSTDIMDEIENEIMPEILAKYPTVTPSFEGQNREFSKLNDSLKPVGLIVLLLIYIVIAFTFRSYSQPLLLLFLIPLSLPAVAWGHWIHDFPVNVLSMLGIIALIGIMVNDGLVLIGKFNNNLREGMTYDNALYEAGRARFRAIFLTSITTVAGLAPLIFEESRQAQFLIPMAISIAYGIGFATVLTLIVLPIFLAFSNSVKTTAKWLWTGNKITKEEVERVTRE